MTRYFLLAVVFAALAFGTSADKNHGAAVGFGVSAGLCVLAAAVVECRRTDPKPRE
ncbi:MAG: hypothetical protein V1809_16540 [Planctomycetota bacterium]